MIEAKKNVMTPLEEERLTNLINDMAEDELRFLVTLIKDSDIMLDEIARREKLSQVKLTAISGLLKIT